MKQTLKLRIEYALTVIDKYQQYNIIDIPHGFALTNTTGRVLCKLENNKVYLGFPQWMTSERFAINGFLYGLDIPTNLAQKRNFRIGKVYYDILTKNICNIADNKPIEKIEVRCQRFFDGHTETKKGLR